MANAVIVLGKSGTGKSTSIKTLNPEETIIINVLGKRLPFKGSNAMYSTEKKNSFQVDGYVDVQNLLSTIGDKLPHIKNIVIDDAYLFDIRIKDNLKIAEATVDTITPENDVDEWQTSTRKEPVDFEENKCIIRN